MIFFSNGLKDYMDINSVEKTSENKNDLIIQTLRDLSQDAVEKTHRIIESRINKFGVSQPNIKKLAVSGRLQIELPGAKDKNRIRNLLQSTASLEFWDGAHSDWTDEFLELNKAVSKKSNELFSDFIEISDDSLNSLADEARIAYLQEKKINDSINEEEDDEFLSLTSIEDIIKPSVGKAFKRVKQIKKSFLRINSAKFDFAISGNKVSSLTYFSPLPKTTNKVCNESLLTHHAASCLACDIRPALLQKLVSSGNPPPKKPST